MIWLDNWLPVFWMVALRYFVIAGLAFLIWYLVFRRVLFFKKIQRRMPKNKDYRREILYSCITILIFSAVPVLILYSPLRQYTQYYKDAAMHGALWYFAAFPLMFIVHDAWFYWTHRLMHHPRVFPWFHKVHHLSVNPSPWAAFSFHPLEAFVEIGIFPVLLFLMPLTRMHLVVFFAVMMVYNVYGHLGWELYPRWFARHWFGKWINTSFNHNQHHQYFKGNYGLYFLWWDRWTGTIRKDYEDRFETHRLPNGNSYTEQGA
ncbi:sterol desaturase family protein [Chitinophaga sp. GCM10012297]|uniref:Sterol desaturase family protein n=1 Tax=Chitinophaga chungangae TaxID=2821488 RepID=A0ABS3YH34_9BACT|nr:sterol desaturase family protein [Chitinophaga chungangae]MBO9153991.1 sterol desaturase family protein [Chitinophaga chungangae]